MVTDKTVLLLSVCFPPEVRLGQFETKHHILCLGLYLNEVFNIRLTVADEDLNKWQKRKCEMVT